MGDPFISDMMSSDCHQRPRRMKLSDYVSTATFKDEAQFVDSRSWIYVATLYDLSEENSFAVVPAFATQVVVQNIKGNLHAFSNICTHRYSILQNKAFGKRPLVCPYHGWSFSSSGLPTIPESQKEQSYSVEELSSLKLQAYKVRDFCNLVFIALDKEGLPELEDYLSDSVGPLSTLTSSIGSLLSREEFYVNANWKLVIENTLDSLHVRQVHPSSLGKLGAYNITNALFCNGHSQFDGSSPSGVEELKKLKKKLGDFNLDISGYRHFFVYPRLTISSVMGLTINIHSVQPLEYNQCRVINSVYATKLNDPEMTSALQRLSGAAMSSFVHQVWHEDHSVIESTQHGMSMTVNQSHDHEYVVKWCLGEERISQFHAYYSSQKALHS